MGSGPGKTGKTRAEATPVEPGDQERIPAAARVVAGVPRGRSIGYIFDGLPCIFVPGGSSIASGMGDTD